MARNSPVSRTNAPMASNACATWPMASANVMTAGRRLGDRTARPDVRARRRSCDSPAILPTFRLCRRRCRPAAPYCQPALGTGTAAVVRTDRPHDPRADVPQLPHLGGGQRTEPEPAHGSHVPRCGLDDLAPALLREEGERVATVVRVWPTAHPAALLQPVDHPGQSRQRPVGKARELAHPPRTFR